MFCPYMEKSNKFCRQVLTRAQLSDAVRLCSSEYHRCPIYVRLRNRASRELVPVRA